MRISARSTVRELAVELPGATRLFEKLGIDYCCGGGKPLEEAERSREQTGEAGFINPHGFALIDTFAYLSSFEADRYYPVI